MNDWLQEACYSASLSPHISIYLLVSIQGDTYSKYNKYIFINYIRHTREDL